MVDDVFDADLKDIIDRALRIASQATDHTLDPATLVEAWATTALPSGVGGHCMTNYKVAQIQASMFAWAEEQNRLATPADLVCALVLQGDPPAMQAFRELDLSTTMLLDTALAELQLPRVPLPVSPPLEY